MQRVEVEVEEPEDNNPGVVGSLDLEVNRNFDAETQAPSQCIVVDTFVVVQMLRD